MRFLSSLGIADPDSFDMDFTTVKNDKGLIVMDIKKDTPWEYALLEEFQESLAPIKYPYSLTFSYVNKPTLEDVDSLFQDWYLSLYHGVSDIVLSQGQEASNILFSYPENESNAANESNIIKDFSHSTRRGSSSTSAVANLARRHGISDRRVWQILKKENSVPPHARLILRLGDSAQQASRQSGDNC